MGFTDADRLRQIVGEPVPSGGTPSDTLFSDAEVTDFITRAGGDLDLAAQYAWEAKAARYANLVNVSEGNSARDMSDLHKQALTMVKFWSEKNGATVGESIGRVRIKRIVRPGGAL